MHSVKPQRWQKATISGSLRRHLRRNHLHLWSLPAHHRRRRPAAPSTYKKMKSLVGSAQEHQYSTIQIPLTSMALIRKYRVSQHGQQSVCLVSDSLDMVPLFPRRHPGTTLEGISIATTSWAIQTTSTGRRSVTPIVSPPSGSSASSPGQSMRRYPPSSREYALLASRRSMILILVLECPHSYVRRIVFPSSQVHGRADFGIFPINTTVYVLIFLIVALPLFIGEMFNIQPGVLH